MDTALKPIFTDEGRRRLLEGIGSSKNYRITQVQVGSGDSNSKDGLKGYAPTPKMTALMSPVQSADATGEVTPDGKRVHVAAVVGQPKDKEEQNTPGITEGEYEIYEIGFFITDVTGGVVTGEEILFAIYARDPKAGPLLSKTPTTDLLLGFDLLLPDLPEDHTITIDKDAYFKFPLATETQPGVLRLATASEATEGSNGEKAITPATLKRAHSLASADGANESAVIVDAAGRVGIGTTTPTTKLDVAGDLFLTVGDRVFKGANWVSNAVGSLSNFGDDNTGFYTVSGGGLQFVTGGADTVRFEASGKVGIGTSSPRTELDTGTGVLSGAANDYIKAQFTLSGGGTVTWGGPGGRLEWTQRFIAISMERGASFSGGHVDIKQPTSDIPAANVYDGNARSATSSGVLLIGWEALYAVHTVGGNQNAVEFRIVRHSSTFHAPNNWILVAMVNDDDHTVKLGTGVTLSKNSSSTKGSPIPRGVIMLWHGAESTIPDGWALCDGSNGATPNLQNLFIVGAGGDYEVGDAGGSDEVTLEIAYGHFVTVKDDGNHYHGGETGQADGHRHAHNTNRSEIPTHIVEYRTIGSGESLENRPRYYALCYIMKL